MRIFAHVCPNCGHPFDRTAAIPDPSAHFSPSSGRYAVFELIDPRDGSTFWIGAGIAKGWRVKARQPYSQRKAIMMKEIRAAGHEPVEGLIAWCQTREQAMRIKVYYCAKIGQAFRGSSRGALGKGKQAKNVAYLAKHTRRLPKYDRLVPPLAR